jgi:hypothetical protein
MTTKSRYVWLRLVFFAALLGILSVPQGAAVALEPTTALVLSQKSRALQLFSDDATVQAALKTLANRGYKLLSRDAVPYRFVYGDEGPISNFLVTAWLGKSETYGWSPAFVMAKVSTDAFGPPTVTLVDARDVESFLR